MEFSDLYNKYKPLINSLIKTYAIDDTSDLRQELLIELYRCENKQPCIPRALRRAAYRYVRRCRRMKEDSLPEDFDVPYYPEPKETSLLDMIESKHILTSEEISFIVERYYKGWDCKDIANTSGVSSEYLYRLNRKVLDKLRPHFRSWIR